LQNVIRRQNSKISTDEGCSATPGQVVRLTVANQRVEADWERRSVSRKTCCYAYIPALGSRARYKREW
jgi:hypothetical protein